MSLTGTFAVVSLTTMVLLAVAVTWLFATTSERQAQRDGEQLAEIYVSQGVQSKIDTESIELLDGPVVGVPAPSSRSLDTVVRANSVQVLDSLSLYSVDGEPLWTSTGRPGGRPAARPWTRRPRQATSLAPVSTVVDSTDGRHVLEVTVPVVYGDRLAGVYGFAQVNIPWDDDRGIRLAVGADRRRRSSRSSRCWPGCCSSAPSTAPARPCAPRPTRTSASRCTTR